MPRFYFNYRTGNRIARDLEGTELPSLGEARKLAFASAREILSDAIRSGRTSPDHVIIVGEDGRNLMTIPLTEVLPESLKR